MADLDKYLRESGQQSVLDAIRGQPGGYEQAQMAYNTGQGQFGSNYQSQNPIDLAKQMYELTQQFAQPAIQTLEGGRAGIAPVYEGLRTTAEAEKEPLTQRYQNLLADITKGTREAASTEFTKRGIPLSSGVVEQTVGSRLAPQIADIGYQKEAGLRDINQIIAGYGQQELGAQTDLDRAIASIQASQGPEAVQSAMNIYQTQEQARQQAAQLALQKWQAEQSNTLAEKQLAYQTSQPNYITLGEGQSLYDPQTLQQLFKNPKTYQSGGGGDTWE